MATLIDPVMASWAPDTRLYVTDDGVHLAVHVAAEFNEFTAAAINESLEASGLPNLKAGVHTMVIEPTTIFECEEDGSITGESIPEPLHTFPPGTTHDDALAQAGY